LQHCQPRTTRLAAYGRLPASLQPRFLSRQDCLHAGMQPCRTRQPLPLLLHGGGCRGAADRLQLRHKLALQRHLLAASGTWGAAVDAASAGPVACACCCSSSDAQMAAPSADMLLWLLLQMCLPLLLFLPGSSQWLAWRAETVRSRIGCGILLLFPPLLLLSPSRLLLLLLPYSMPLLLLCLLLFYALSWRRRQRRAGLEMLLPQG
jgi:hypothetical protein